MKTFLGIDIGTTNSKVGVCDEQWRILKIYSVQTPVKKDAAGYQVYDGPKLWETLKSQICDAVKTYQPEAIGITSMAESGIIVDKLTGEEQTDIIPWTDKRAVPYFEEVRSNGHDEARFYKTGLHNSYKYSVYKIMTALKEMKVSTANTVWLQAAPYIAYKLTGKFGIDRTLALRTYAYDLYGDSYDENFLNNLGLSEDIFPSVYHSGEMMGMLKECLCQEFKCAKNIPIAICGHDHLCAAVAVGAVEGQDIFMSLGTTAVLMGNFKKRPLLKKDFETGFSYGLHIVKDKMTWLGSIQAAGSAVDWCRKMLNIDETDYKELDGLLNSRGNRVGDIIFFPYLSGSGAPMLNVNVRAGFVGLDMIHDRSDLLFAVLEGIAYEIRMILEHTSSINDRKAVRVVGGGTKNEVLLQVLADVLGNEIAVTECEQATLTGAAMLASGISLEEIYNEKPAFLQIKKRYMPDPTRSQLYSEKYLSGYLPMQKLIREN